MHPSVEFLVFERGGLHNRVCSSCLPTWRTNGRLPSRRNTMLQIGMIDWRMHLMRSRFCLVKLLRFDRCRDLRILSLLQFSHMFTWTFPTRVCGIRHTCTCTRTRTNAHARMCMYASRNMRAAASCLSPQHTHTHARAHTQTYEQGTRAHIYSARLSIDMS